MVVLPHRWFHIISRIREDNLRDAQTRSNSPVIDISIGYGIKVAASPLRVSMHFYQNIENNNS
jgi:hypothetical protein